MNRTDDFEGRVKRVLKGLRPGELATYGEIAEEAGSPHAARAVGNLLSKSGEDLPWWRVVRADGSLAARHRNEQVQRLESEGIRIKDGRAIGGGRRAD
ncbi:MAG TPA: MGMT family protein [Actinomycetota bacterium]|nr:MGMT family protein [Actinomycetota bacterium]